MPSGIWLDDQSFNQSGGLLWAQNQLNQLGQNVQNQWNSGQDWAQQQINGLLSNQPSAPESAPPTNALSSPGAQQQPPAATAQELGQQWGDNQISTLLQSQPQPTPQPDAQQQPNAYQQGLNQTLSAVPAQAQGVARQALGLPAQAPAPPQTTTTQTPDLSQSATDITQTAAVVPSVQSGPANDKGQIFPLPIRPDNAPSATYHSQGGSDLMAPRGTPVLSMQGGTVTEVYQEKGQHQFGGNAVLIHGNDGLDYYYAHFDQPTALKVGDQVNTGQQIGQVGNTGNAWKGGQGATHLHVGVGYGITSGEGADAGLGSNYNAQNLLASLENGVPDRQPGQTWPSPSAPVTAPLKTAQQQGVPLGPQPKQAGDLIDQARQAAVSAGIDPEIFTRQIQQESGFNPNAKSGAGAVGIAQFMPGTAQGLGIDPSDPQQALTAAAKLDAQNLQKYNGDWSKTLAAYNAGGGSVDKYGGVPPFQETQNYISSILGGAQNVIQQVGQNVQSVVGAITNPTGTALNAGIGVGQNLQPTTQDLLNQGSQLIAQGQSLLNQASTGVQTGAQSLLNQGQQTGQNLLTQGQQALQPANQLLQTVQDYGQPVGSAINNFAYGGPIGAFNENLRGLGQDVNQGLGQGLALLSPSNRQQLAQQLEQTDTGNVPVLSGAANLGLNLGGSLIGGPSALDSMQTLQDLQNKYKPDFATADWSQLTPAQRVDALTPPDPSQMTPEDAQSYREARMIIGGVSLPPEQPGETTIYGPSGEVLSQVKPPALPTELNPSEVVQRAVNINLQKYPEEVRDTISSMAESLPETMSAARRGVVTDQAVHDLSQQTGMDVGQIVQNWQPGQAQNAETLLAMRDALAAQSQRVLDAQDLLRQDPTSQPAQANFMGELLQHAAIQEAVTGATAEAGRALRVLNQPVEGSQFAVQQMQQMAQRSGMTTDDLVNEISRMDLSDPAQVAQLARQADVRPPTFNELFRLYHTGSVVSGLQTIGKVANSTIMAPAWNMLGNTAADLATWQPSRIQGSAVAALGTLRDIPQEFFQGFLGAYTKPESVGQRFADLGQPVQSAAARVFETPMALHAGLQQVAQDIVARLELGRMAGTQATREGLQGGSWFARVEDLIGNPQPGWSDTAQGIGKRAALRGDLGQFGSTMETFINRLGENPVLGPVARTIWPVFRIGMNFQTQRVEQSPIGLGGTLIDTLRGIMAKQGPYAGANWSDIGPALRGLGPGATEEDIARYAANPFVTPGEKAVTPLRERFINNVIGTAISVGAALRAFDGTITGAGPEDPTQRASMMAEGWQPYSILVGDRYYSYLHTPGAYALALVANYADAVNYPSAQEKQQILSGRAPLGVVPGTESRVDYAAERYVKSMFELMGSEAGLTQLSDMVDTLSQGATANTAARAIGGLVESFVPMSGALRSVANMTDPSQRQAESLNPLDIVGQTAAEAIPGLREQVPARLSPLGENLPNPQAGLGAVAPMPTRQIAGNPILTALSDVGESIGAAPQAIPYGHGSQILLNPDEQRTYQQLKGDMVQQILGPMIQSGQWQQMDGATQRAVWQSIEPATAQYAQGMLLGQMDPNQAVARAQFSPSAYLYPVSSYGPENLTASYMGQQALMQRQAQHQAFLQAMNQRSPLLAS